MPATAAPRRTARGAPHRRAATLAVLLAVAGLVAGSRPADAGRQWCRTDPLVLVGGQLADIFVAGPLNAPLLVTGPTEVVVTVPVGVPAYLILSDLGFGYGEVVTFVESRALRTTAAGIELQIDVLVPATDSTMPVMVEFAPRILGILWPDRVEGTANSWVTMRTVL